MRKLMLACVPFLVLMTFAQAQSIDNVVQDFRLIGAWASDCYKPPDPRNEHATFSKTPSGDIQLVNDFGSNYDHMVYRIVQYRFAIGSSSAGNSVITRQPLSVTTTSSSMRAAE